MSLVFRTVVSREPYAHAMVWCSLPVAVVLTCLAFLKYSQNVESVRKVPCFLSRLSYTALNKVCPSASAVGGSEREVGWRPKGSHRGPAL